MMSYFIFIGHLISAVFEIEKENQKWVSCAAVFCVIMPLSCLRNIDSLKVTSFLAVLTVLYVVVMVVVAAFGTPEGYGPSTYSKHAGKVSIFLFLPHVFSPAALTDAHSHFVFYRDQKTSNWVPVPL